MHVAKQSSLARRSSSQAGYQAKWSIYRQWCRSEGHSISRPSLPKVVDFLFWLRRSKKLSVSAVLGYCSMLSAVFRSQLPETSTSPVIQDLLRSFKVEAPCCAVRPPSRDLMKVLEYLRSPGFELLMTCLLRDPTRDFIFSIFGHSQTSGGTSSFFSCGIVFLTSAGLSYVPEFLATTETAVRQPSSLLFDSVSAIFCGRSSGRVFVMLGSLLTGVLTEDFEIC